MSAIINCTSCPFPPTGPAPSISDNGGDAGQISPAQDVHPPGGIPKPTPALMPLGPRPEPPPLPRKEPNPKNAYIPKLVSHQPPLPPKVGLNETTYLHLAPDPASMSSNIAQMAPSPHSRLKGPRPLGSPLSKPASGRNLASSLPYPINTEPVPVLRPQSPQLSPLKHRNDQAEVSMPDIPSPARSIPSYSSVNYSPSRSLAMPEPDLINSPSWSSSPTNPNRFRGTLPRDNFSRSSLDSYYLSNTSLSHSSLYPLTFDSSNSTLNSTAVNPPPVPIIVPPPATGQEKRPTRSIFQWGIPTELLPPMPVPVNSMSGLVMGDQGQLTMDFNLPESPGPARSKFSVEQITVADLQRVSELWSLSALARWIYELVVSIDAEFSIGDVHQLLTRLFMFRTENLKWEHAEALASSTVASLQQQNFILGGGDSPDPTLLHLSSLGPTVSGVLTELTGSDGQCYATSPHESGWQSACYSSRCHQRMNVRALPIPQAVNAVNLLRVPSTGGTTVLSSVYSAQSSVVAQDPTNTTAGTCGLVGIEAALNPENSLEMNWRRFWHLEESDIKDIDPKIVKLQFAIHELIVSEISFVRDLITYQDVYGEIELMRGLSVMSKQEEFCTRVYGRIRVILSQNKILLTDLLARQASQGPYIYDIGDLITQWAQNPKTVAAYTDYADDYLWSDHHLRQELMQSTRLQHWMEERARDPRIMGRPHSFFFHRVLPRLARYQLLLSTVLKYISEDMVSEYRSVETAMKASTKLAQLCDDRVAKQKRVMDVQNLKAHIVFKSTAVTADLKLGEKRRKLLRRGDMIRRGDMKMDWVETHMLLLDNFLVLSKTREGANGTAFYVTKPPIPLDLLVLEADNEEGVVKMASRLTLTRHTPADEPSGSTDNEKSPILYPMRITHLGSNGQKYLLYLPTRPERSQWSQAIQDAKQSRAHLAYARSAEPFSFKQVSDCFGYPENELPALPIPVSDTPLNRAVTSTTSETAPRIVLRRCVNCLVAVGDAYILGTDFGLWLGDGSTWKRVLDSPQRIIKIEVLENMNIVFILCGDHHLSWYPLDQIVARGMGDHRRVLGVRLNRQRKVTDFSVAFHLGRVVLLYLQHGGILKLVEPIRSHGVMAMHTVEKIGIDRPSSCIDSFREVDRIHAPSDVTRITPMTKCIILNTAKHFEWTTIATKRAVRLPVGNTVTKEMQYYGRPLRMIKLDATHFLKCFESCYVICDHEGRDCIQPTTWFLDKAVDCAFYSPYLILFSQGGEMIEVRYVEEFPGRLVQIVTGKDIKLLSNGDEAVYLRMAHPWLSGRQLILQLMGNEIVRESTSTWHSSSV